MCMCQEGLDQKARRMGRAEIWTMCSVSSTHLIFLKSLGMRSFVYLMLIRLAHVPTRPMSCTQHTALVVELYQTRPRPLIMYLPPWLEPWGPSPRSALQLQCFLATKIVILLFYRMAPQLLTTLAMQMACETFFLKTVPLLDEGDDVAMVLTPQAFHNLDVDIDIFNHANIHFWECAPPLLPCLHLIREYIL